MSNIFNEENDDDTFRDIPDEVQLDKSGRQVAAPQPEISQQRPVQPQAAPVYQQAPQPQYEEPVQIADEDEEEDYSEVINDARFRLEQGRLYEIIMNNNIFGDAGDEKAAKFVMRKVRNFAKEQMEIMLGMRQEKPEVQPLSVANFPFNDAEVQALKDLAFMATKGASAAPEAQHFSGVPQAAAPKPVSFKPISIQPKAPSATAPKPAPKQAAPAPAKPLAQKAAAPVKRDQRTEAQIEQILAEEGISREEYERQYNPTYKPLAKPFQNMSDEEIKEWKRQDALKTNKQVKNPSAIPMPSPEQEEMLHTQRAQAAASHPQMQSIMSLLLNKK